MENTRPQATPGAPQRTEITCNRCSAKATVPFVPTPGRPVYCRACFERSGPSSPSGRGRAPVRRHSEPRQRMLNMRRKGHFVHDAMAALDAEADMEDQQRRAFVEMLFTRGARQTSAAALEFLEEKRAEGLVSDEEADGLERILERYSVRR